MASAEQTIAERLSSSKKKKKSDEDAAFNRRTNCSISSNSSQLSSHKKTPKSTGGKKLSTRTVESGVSVQTGAAAAATGTRNHHSFNQRLRNMLEIFRCRLSSNSSSSRRSSQQKQRQSIASSHAPAQLPPPPPATSRTATAEPTSSTCCQLCINECSERDLNDGTSFMYSIGTCEHSFCVNCLRLYLKYQIVESRVSIPCPQCSEKMHPADIHALLSLPVRCHLDSESGGGGEVRPVPATSTILARTREEAAEQQRQWTQLIDKYEEFMLRRVLVTIPDIRYCPAPDCTYAVIASGCANCPQLTCQRDNCNTSFCYHCKQYWHPNLTCEDAAIQNNQSTLSAVGSYMAAASGSNFNKYNSSSNILRSFLQRSNSHISVTSLSATTTNGATGATTVISSTGRTTTGAGGSSGVDLIKDEIKRCPKCQALIVKMDDGSCNHITCAVCGCEFCWLCMKEISDLHYLSPSGCTFWGKKPWSRKKKILWQLGTLIGAPVGIALVAGVAVPAIIIGLPIWAGRKVYVRYKSIGKHKRNLIVFGTVVGTVVVAPFVAALAVGIGVPILLAYVYGVVPISLCRSGGCGVTTNNNGGVRFAFDDENTDNLNFFQNSASQTAASTSKAAKTSSKTSAAVVPNSVTVPISAIDTRPTDSIGMSTASSSPSESTAVATATVATAASGQKKSVSINTSNNLTSPTPVLVTITMAKKSNMAARGAASERKQKRRRAKPATSAKKTAKQEAKAAKRQALKSRFACDASAQMTATASATIASVACGSVESNQESVAAMSSVESGRAAEIAGNVLTQLATISKNKLTSSLQIPAVATTSSADLSSSSLSGTASASSCHLLLGHSKDDAATAQQQQQRQSINSDSSLHQKAANESKNAATAVKTRAADKAKLNNPSIGEASIGAYTTSMSASETNLDDVKSGGKRTLSEAADNAFEDDEDESDSDSDSDDDDEDDEDDEDESSEEDEEHAEHKPYNEDMGDRDSASNRAIASGSLCKDYPLETCSVSFSIKQESTGGDKQAKQAQQTDTKSAISAFTCQSITSEKADTYSVSMKSEKSINPSVMALAGSIKDNQSVDNLSSEYANTVSPPSAKNTSINI